MRIIRRAIIIWRPSLNALGRKPSRINILIPNISARFHRGAPIGIYLQIYNAGIDQTTLRPSAQVEYTLFRDGKQIQKQTEDWRNTKMTGDRLNLSRLLASDALTPGNYAIEVRVSDQVSGQSLVRKESFTVVP